MTALLTTAPSISKAAAKILAADQKMAEKFEKMADALEKQIVEKRRPSTQNYTPKRGREEMSRRIEATRLERCQIAMRRLAELYRNGAVNNLLAGFKTKADIALAVSTRLDSTGYYEIHDTGEFHRTDAQSVALQQLLLPQTDDEKKRRLELDKQAELQRLLNSVRGVDIPGFFPTPADLARDMVRLANIGPGDDVLEPSAGIGSIAEEIRAAHPDADVTCVEVNHTLANIVMYKGFSIVRDDFLEWSKSLDVALAGRCFDAIVMNPPFERGQDAEHILAAWQLLKPGGRLVALCAGNALEKSGKKYEALQALFESEDLHCNGSRYQNFIPDAFAGSDSFRRTGTSVNLIMMQKPLEN